MTDSKPNAPRLQPRKPALRGEKRTPLTHFLCLPLVNASSLPQLEQSLVAFKRTHPPVHGSAPAGTQPEDAPSALIPDGAVRPVGTLHLTLGVMSLPTRERLAEAVAFFHSLDLAGLMHEAERVAAQKRAKSTRSQPSPAASKPGHHDGQHLAHPGSDTTQPLTVSLESLHALPRAKAATVLHASPVDTTARLYPFCVMLRDKFLEAGYLEGESKDKQPDNKHSEIPQGSQDELHVNPNKSQAITHYNEPVAETHPLLEELPTHLAEEAAAAQIVTSRPSSHAQQHAPAQPKLLDPYTAALMRKPKPRPLLLHATLVNTIYVRGRRRGEDGSNPGKTNGPRKQQPNNGSKRLFFDARDLLSRYRDYYADEERTTPRAAGFIAASSSDADTIGEAETIEATEHEPLNNDSPSGSPSISTESCEGTGSKRKAPSSTPPQYPFVWAKDILLDSVCICEMGAKKLSTESNPNNGDDGLSQSHELNARLGEKYTVVVQRSLDFSRGSPRPVSSASSGLTEGSVDGGVHLG
ncbi:hypothetical protein NUU61_002676 [Penicillium alfredii]|uniref:A-kinase anchor protein 7-like phosphoesterase domain-containing protein n=1 Tax=Penicillium alfredii TaxID=1506179 RepID=A0A9W9KG66_9EURO|nr:uncharacterized protein NUU61_002676 [Penicillium alfredii]KAJ5105329.1 hypothetical protein NUU61_002676 [Penicillium alfredii]